MIQSTMSCSASAGRSSPLGATVVEGGVNFSVFSRNATGMELLLFDREDDPRPARVIQLDHAVNRSYHYWHTFVSGVKPGQLYGYRAHGPFNPASGARFEPGKILLDPYGRGVVVPRKYSREAARHPGDNCATAMKSVVADVSTYDWEATLRSNGPLPGPSSTRCTSGVSPGIRVRALKKTCAEPTPA